MATKAWRRKEIPPLKLRVRFYFTLFFFQIPVLSPSTNHLLRDHQLIRFIGMVQDMYNPEYFLGRYEVANKDNTETCVRSGRYRDTAACSVRIELFLFSFLRKKRGEQRELANLLFLFQGNEYVLFNSSKNVNEERQTFYCITIPAINTWASPVSFTNFRRSRSKSKLKFFKNLSRKIVLFFQ